MIPEDSAPVSWRQRNDTTDRYDALTVAANTREQQLLAWFQGQIMEAGEAQVEVDRPISQLFSPEYRPTHPHLFENTQTGQQTFVTDIAKSTLDADPVWVFIRTGPESVDAITQRKPDLHAIASLFHPQYSEQAPNLVRNVSTGKDSWVSDLIVRQLKTNPDWQFIRRGQAVPRPITRRSREVDTMSARKIAFLGGALILSGAYITGVLRK
jgi:hypothetical protein